MNDSFPIPRVVDLSHYDDVQDAFTGAINAGIWGVINKVTEGLGSHDASFLWRRGPARASGLCYGAYHFLRPGRIQEQADWYVQHIGDTKDLCLALDHEDSRVPLADAELWMKTVHAKLGRWPILYSGAVIKEQLGQRMDPFWGSIKLWLSHYSDHPKWPPTWKEPWLIQYTGDGQGPRPHNIPGIVCHGERGIDINHYAGTKEQLHREWAA